MSGAEPLGRPLRARIPVLLLVLGLLIPFGTLLIGTNAYLSYRSESQERRDRLAQDLVATANQLAISLALPLWNFDRPQTAQILDSFAADRVVEQIELRTGSGRSQATARSRGPQWILLTSERLPTGNPPRGLLVAERPIRHSGEIIGQIAIGYTTRFLEADLRSLLVKRLWHMLAADLMLVLCLSLILWRTVLHPLRKIQRFTQVVSSGSVEGLAAPAGTFFGEMAALQASLAQTFGLLQERLDAHQQAREALRKRNEVMEAILENAPIGFAVHGLSDSSGQFVSARFEEIYGVARGALTSFDGLFDQAWHDPVARETWRARVAADIASGDPARMHWLDVPLQLPSGEFRYLNAVSILLKDHDLVVATVQDVSARVRMEVELEDSRANLAALIESTSDLIWSVDLEQRLVTCNPVFRSYFRNAYGIEPELGSRASDLLPADRAGFWPPLYQRVLDGGPLTVDCAFPDGRTFELSLNRIHRGLETTGISVFAKDITERRRAEAALKASELHFQEVLEFQPVPITISRRGQILHFNLAFGNTFGFTGQETPTVASWMEQAYPDPVYRRDCARLWQQDVDSAIAEDRSTTPREYRVTCADGTLKQVIITGRRIGDDFLATFNDITQLREAEQSRHQLEDQLQHLHRMESVGRLAGGISHDMNNVLAAIMAVAELLRLRGGEQLRQVELILDATRRGRNLLQGLMAFARKEVEETEFIDLNELVRKEAELLSSTTLQRIRLELSLAPGLP
jgi:PAS domain S-box-containing protein